jgi:hypothetical protein
MYDTRDLKTKEKRKLAADSISAYLQQYSSMFSYEKILAKIKESQIGKAFMLWDCENFHIQELEVGNIQVLGIKSVKDSYFDLNVVNLEYDVRVRVNWGNNACVANPRWKFTFIKK